VEPSDWVLVIILGALIVSPLAILARGRAPDGTLRYDPRLLVVLGIVIAAVGLVVLLFAGDR
jgi:hypothetical protein